MADLKNAIREMLRRGMTEAQVKENLSEMGVADVDGVFAEATEHLSPMLSSVPQQEESEQAPSSEENAPETIQEPMQSLSPAPSTSTNERDIDDIRATLSTLVELNKKILETNRAILLRLKEE